LVPGVSTIALDARALDAGGHLVQQAPRLVEQGLTRGVERESHREIVPRV